MASFSVAEVARACGGRVVGDGDRRLAGVRSLEGAGAESLSFVMDAKALKRALSSRAAAFLARTATDLPERTVIEVADPGRGVADRRSKSGQSDADHGYKSELLGVAAAGKVTFPGGPADTGDGRTKLDPNHSHFVLIEGADSGAETAALFDLAAAFDVPVLTILVNGGSAQKTNCSRACGAAGR